MTRHNSLHVRTRVPRIHHTVDAASKLLRAALFTLGGLAGGALLSGCEPPTAPPPPPPQQSLALTLGTIDQVAAQQSGSIVWVDLSDGQSVQVAPGAQGGFHVWLMYRVGGNGEARRVHVQRLADRIAPDGTRQRVLSTDGIADLPAQAAQDVWQTPMPVPSFMCPTPIGVNILDAPVEIDVKLTEDTPEAKLLAESHVRLNLSCPPEGDPQREFCLRICKG